MTIPTFFSARLLQPLSLLVALLALASHSASAQFVTTAPVQDGIITAGEYGGSQSGPWYMAWDDDKLYIAKTGGQPGEPVYIYLDIDPIVPVNGGNGGNGNIIGTSDFNTQPTLSMRADVRIYWNSGASYIEFKSRTNSGTWSVPNTTGSQISLGTSGGNNREMFIRWDAMPLLTTRPAAFNWLGYESYGTSPYGIYDHTPTENNFAAGGTTGGNTPPLNYYNTVSTTAATGTTNPFGRVSYSYPTFAAANALSFGAISVYDFTMNTQDGTRFLSRGNGGGDWNIAGTLTVGNGSLYFGSGTSNYGATNVGNIRVTGGLLSADQSTQPLNVAGNILLNGGLFELASQLGGGDLFVKGDFTIDGGSFNDFNRQVNFTGTGTQTVSNIPLNATTGFTFSFLGVNKPSGILALGSNATLTRTATLTNGEVQTGSNTFFLSGSQGLLNETNTSYITGKVQSTQTLGSGGGASPQPFNGIGLTVTPRNSSAAAGPTTVLRTTGTRLTGVNGNQSASRYFTVTPTTNTGLDFGLDFRYLPVELTAAQAAAQNTLLLFSSAGTTIPFAHLAGSTSAGNVVSRIDITDLARTFTIADAANPLPVELLGFAGQATDGSALLSWKTAQEVRFRAFEVQRQTGSGAWETLGSVPGRAATGASYTYRTALPAARTSYFRLRLLDQDGSSRYSQVVALAAAPAGTRAVFLSPVPATSQLAISTGHSEATAIRIYDVRGRLLLQAEAPTGTATVAVASLAPGLYVLETTSAGSSQRTRFVKE